MHWVDVYAEKLLSQGKSHVVESGTGISGQPHLGSAEDIVISDMISKVIIKNGGRAKAVWAMDDMDGLRKIPEQLPTEFNEYLGWPAFKLPCPDSCCDSFAEHFSKPFLESLLKINVKPEVVSVASMYREGKYDEVIKTALEQAGEINSILSEISGSEKEEGWLPFFPICEKCGRILTTVAVGFDGSDVSYKCAGKVAGKSFIEGCGHEGKVGIREGKLPWRVEWAARWSILGVTCEPMGKDLTAAGGTYETSSVICEKIFDHKAPLAIPYEWIVFKGRKLGKSAGLILTLGEMIDLATPEITRYFFFRSQPTTHKEIDFEMAIPKLAEEYEMAEKVYFGQSTDVPEKEIDDIKRTYAVSQTGDIPEKFFQVPYSHLTSVVQTSADWDSTLEVLGRTEHIEGMTPAETEKVKQKAEAVKNWLNTRAPEHVKFRVQETPPKVEVSAVEREILKLLLIKLENLEWAADKIHDTVHSIAMEADIKAGPMFKLMYRIFLAKERGPRLGYLMASLDKEFVLERVGHFIK